MTRRQRKGSGCGRRLLAALGVVGVLAAACGGDGSGDTASGQGVDGPLRIGTSWEITTPDPDTEAFWAPEFGYGELLLRPTHDAEPEPWVLESAEPVSPTEWELELHEGVTFQNGKPCDAEAVAAMMNRQLAENSLLEPVLPGAVAEATGPTTVMLTTKAPVSFVPNLLAHEEMFPVYDVEAKKAAGEDEQALIEAGLYTGPYRPAELNAEHMVLERNDDYWQGRPALPGVEIKFIPDHQARVLAVESGEVDVALYPPTEAAATLEGSSTSHYVTASEGTGGPRVIFNLDKAPIDDVLVRQALSAAFDYEALANEVMEGYYNVGEGLYPEHLPFAVANQKHDPEAAGDLLDQAGWTESGEDARAKDGKPLELTLVTYRADPDLLTMAVAIRSQLEALGIDLEVREIEDISAIFDEDFEDWHFALFRTGFFGVAGDIEGIVHDYLKSDGARNRSGIDDPDIDAIAEELATTFDEEERHDLLRELQDIVIDEKAYTIIPASKRESAVVSDQWADFEPSGNYLHVDWETAP